MVVMSKNVEEYFNNIQMKVKECYDLAEIARNKGLDPETFVESPQAKDLAGRVEKLIEPEGVAELIRLLKAQGKSEDMIVFQVVSDILERKIGDIEKLEDRVERAIRVGLAIKTMGVVSAPLEGISKILIKKDQQGKSYLSLYFAGPIRAAGGTTAGLCVLIADFVRKKSNIPKYEATEGEIGRYVEEIKLYDRRVHLQYPSTNNEIRFAVEHLPVEINGDSTEDEEVSAFRDLPRVDTNNIRGGACLVLNDGILSKAKKLLKIAKLMDLKGWEWLANLKSISHNSDKNLTINKEDNIIEKSVTPNPKYIADIIAGRPVFSHPSRIGGHRLRYGRSRNTGLAAGGMHPVSMILLDKFIAIGTQLRIERPGKSTSVCPVTSIETPIVKLKNGNVIRIDSMNKAEKIFPMIKKVLFIGDIIFGYGEFAENNHQLIPSGYVEEWWVLEFENEINKKENKNHKYKKYIDNPFDNIPTAELAIELSLEYNIPLHPKYTDYWGNLEVNELEILREAFGKSYIKNENSIRLENEQSIRKILEKAFVLHKIKDNKILFSSDMNKVYEKIFNLSDYKSIKPDKKDDVFTYFSKITSIKIKNKAPYFIGSRMGRPEKSERKTMKGIHSLFPLSDVVGSSRLFEKAIENTKIKNDDFDSRKYDKKRTLRNAEENKTEVGKIKIDVCRRICPKCKSINIFNTCSKCKSHTDLTSICINCKKLYPAVDPDEKKLCPQCKQPLKASFEKSFDIKSHMDSVLKKLQITFPKKIKGIIGLTNAFKVPEPVEKGILRARNGVLVYKTAEVRYDATDIPLTHFKPKEIGITINKLKELGYEYDYKGSPLVDDEQIIELHVQDILLSDDCAEYLIKVSKFLDEELEYFYQMKRFYNVKERDDLIGHLTVGLAPHTSAGIIGRIIGFSPARSIYAHPYWHAAKRRNCDGDEDAVMLLLDPLLNFSRNYLPSKIGGRMDATLVIGTLLDPNEIDSEAHNIDTLYRYPLEFYEATQRYVSPNEIEEIMDIVKNRLGTNKQYEQIGFNIPTKDINLGPKVTAYKTYESMDDKIEAQLHLAKIIKAVDAKNVATKILSTHFNPDILGNLRKFSVQEFRCVKCNKKYRRPPLSNSGKCPKCGNNIILTVNKGGIHKYVPRAIKLCEDFNLDAYTCQSMELVEEYITSLADNPKIKQQKLSDFF